MPTPAQALAHALLATLILPALAGLEAARAEPVDASQAAAPPVGASQDWDAAAGRWQQRRDWDAQWRDLSRETGSGLGTVEAGAQLGAWHGPAAEQAHAERWQQQAQRTARMQVELNRWLDERATAAAKGGSDAVNRATSPSHWAAVGVMFAGIVGLTLHALVRRRRLRHRRHDGHRRGRDERAHPRSHRRRHAHAADSGTTSHSDHGLWPGEPAADRRRHRRRRRSSGQIHHHGPPG